jgi:hypothetical protein
MPVNAFTGVKHTGHYCHPMHEEREQVDLWKTALVARPVARVVSLHGQWTGQALPVPKVSASHTALLARIVPYRTHADGAT